MIDDGMQAICMYCNLRPGFFVDSDNDPICLDCKRIYGVAV